jgi:hypothetical protein
LLRVLGIVIRERPRVYSAIIVSSSMKNKIMTKRFSHE